MSEQGKGREYRGYDYKQVVVKDDQLSFHMDCYANLGWSEDENTSVRQERGKTLLRLKRDKNNVNKTELIRLERNLEACFAELDTLENSKTNIPTIWAMTCGLIGTAFMAGSTFAVTAEPPMIGLCIVLAVPGFLGWIFPYFIFKNGVKKRTEKVQPFLETKQNEIEEICRKGCSLL